MKTFSIEIRGVHLESRPVSDRDFTGLLLAIQGATRMNVIDSILSGSGLSLGQIAFYPDRESAEKDLCYTLRRILPGLKGIPDVFPEPDICMLELAELYAIAGSISEQLYPSAKSSQTSTDIWAIDDETWATTLELPTEAIAEWRRLGAEQFAAKVLERDHEMEVPGAIAFSDGSAIAA